MSIKGSVLIVGAVLDDQPNTFQSTSVECARSKDWLVFQDWRHLTVPYRPRTRVLNEAIASHDLDRFDYVLICDDDVELPAVFLDRYLAIVDRFHFDLAQPARIGKVDHEVTKQQPTCVARLTSFVEVGPVVSFGHLTQGVFPLDEACAMGWGLDLAWSARAPAAGWRLGIVDATPIGHRLRSTGQHYDKVQARAERDAYLGSQHVPLVPLKTLVNYWA